MDKKYISIIMILYIQMAFAAESFSTSVSWHTLQQVTTDQGGTASVDGDADGIIDSAENLTCTDPYSCYINTYPGGSLVISGNSASLLNLYTSSDQNFIGLYENGVRKWAIGHDGEIVTDGFFIYQDDGATQTPFKILPGSFENTLVLKEGKIGIRTDSPLVELDINGDLRIQGKTSCGKLYTDASGNVLCGVDGFTDGDADPTNEIQTLGTAGTTGDNRRVTLTSGGSAYCKDITGSPALCDGNDAVNDGVYDLATMRMAVSNDFHNLGGIETQALGTAGTTGDNRRVTLTSGGSAYCKDITGSAALCDGNDAVNDGVYDLSTMRMAVSNDFHNLGGTETDPKVGTLTNGKWCTSDGNTINCQSNAPETIITCSCGICWITEMVSWWSGGVGCGSCLTYGNYRMCTPAGWVQSSPTICLEWDDSCGAGT